MRLIVLATTALSPHIHDPALRRTPAGPAEGSLRDLGPDIICVRNITDDVAHAVRENTSPTWRNRRRKPISDGTLYDVIPAPSGCRATGRRFSPFGLGVLDLALGRLCTSRRPPAGRA